MTCKDGGIVNSQLSVQHNISRICDKSSAGDAVQNALGEIAHQEVQTVLLWSCKQAV
jgi:hypothetical protein